MTVAAFPTIRSRIAMGEYRAIDALNISRLKELKRSPMHYRHRLENPLETPPLVLGTAAHCATLEPERFERQFAVWSRRSENTGNLCPRNGKFWDAFLAEHAGKDVITEDEANRALSIAQAVRLDPVAAKYLESGDPEVTMEWTAHGRRCKARVDWITHRERPTLVGLKTTRDCRLFAFGAQAAKLDYPMQWAFYFNGYVAIRHDAPDLIEIVVESEPPHAVAVYRINADILLQGEEEYLRLLAVLEQCEASDEWPGPATQEQILTLPSWYYGERTDDLSDIGLEG